MSDPAGGLLTDEQRSRLRARDLDAAAHRTLDAEVGYRVRALASGAARVDVERLVADVRLLEGAGHNATVSMVRTRLADHLPSEDRP